MRNDKDKIMYEKFKASFSDLQNAACYSQKFDTVLFLESFNTYIQCKHCWVENFEMQYWL